MNPEHNSPSKSHTNPINAGCKAVDGSKKALLGGLPNCMAQIVMQSEAETLRGSFLSGSPYI